MSAMTPQDLATLYRKMSHFDKTLDFEFKVKGPGEVEYGLTIGDRHLSSPETCHGGVLAGLMDAIIGMTVLSDSVTKGLLCSTVEFKINFIKPAIKDDRLSGTGIIDYSGNSLVVASGSIFNQKGEIVCKGMGTFNLYPLHKKDLSHLMA